MIYFKAFKLPWHQKKNEKGQNLTLKKHFLLPDRHSMSVSVSPCSLLLKSLIYFVTPAYTAKMHSHSLLATTERELFFFHVQICQFLSLLCFFFLGGGDLDSSVTDKPCNCSIKITWWFSLDISQHGSKCTYNITLRYVRIYSS